MGPEGGSQVQFSRSYYFLSRSGGFLWRGEAAGVVRVLPSTPARTQRRSRLGQGGGKPEEPPWYVPHAAAVGHSACAPHGGESGRLSIPAELLSIRPQL